MRNDTQYTTRVVGALGEFHSPDALLAAVRELRHTGYRRLDAYSPFPIHGLDKALNLRETNLAWYVLGAGLMGGLAALAGQWWTNAVDYPYIISGKPLFSLPANIPVTFEVVILCIAFTAFAGVFALSRLPQFAHPLLRSQQILRASDDRFYALIDARDERFTASESAADLRASGAERVQLLKAEDSPSAIPRAVWIWLTVLLVASVIPPLLIARSRGTTSERPPLRSFGDMDFQPKFKTQTRSSFFADGRSMRPPVVGTVARGQLQSNDAFYHGVSTVGAADAWVDTIPVPITDELMRRGRERFNIYCATCHGRGGEGNGPVSVRALALEQGTWVPPTSLHADHVRQQPVGQLYQTITNGVRKMPGYASQVEPADRWAIVLYMRALQRSQHASPADLWAEQLRELRDLN